MSVWFITGASRGLGRELAAAALEAGEQVIAAVRDTGAALEALPEAGDALLAVQLDVTDEQQAEKAVAAGVERFGQIDVLVNNAGDPQRERRRWAESGLLGDNGGTLIVTHGTDRVGSVSWRKVQTGPGVFNWAIGIGLAPEFRGRGHGSAAQRLVACYLFANTQVNRVEATTEITNLAEQRALEKAGFTREGVLRGTAFRQGRWHDQVIFSVLRDEIRLDDCAAADGVV